ncbi:MAG TPA: 3'(2'),5'-bisphosphate nucleotidase CysQ [Verrucomicrobiae bacterium]|nr:3'(2'),5'-bisphosphate nucleotidase CysQ [Verrucomicrobiae bacterium]
MQTELMDLSREFAVAVSMAVRAGAIVRRHHERGVTPEHKADGELVTAADREADATIRAVIEVLFPRDAVYSEEGANDPARLSRARVWIVDPIDSTSDFLAGGDEHTVSIGLAIGGAPVLGVVYNPARRVMFAGAAGVGVRFNDAAVAPTDISDPELASVAVSKKELARGVTFGGFGRLRPLSSMAYKLARVAAGMDDAVVSFKHRREYGTCAGVALVLAAGGRATLLDGSPIVFNRREPKQPLGMIAAGANLHEALIRRFAAVAGAEQ